MAITHIRKKWTDSIITRLSRSLTRTPVTKTTDPITGSETLTTGATATISGVFQQTKDTWTQEREGLMEMTNAYVIVKAAVTLNKEDLITVNSDKYRVGDVLIRYSDDNNSTALYKYAGVFLQE